MDGVAIKKKGPLEAAHAQINDEKYDMVECGAAGKTTLDLSDQLHGCSNNSTHNYRMSSANVLV